MTALGLGRRDGNLAPIAVLLLLSALGWFWTVRFAREMGNGPGPMGLAITSFIGVWVVMMAAMMLPTLSALTISGAGRRTEIPTTATFAAGYLTVWGVAGTLFYAASLGTKALADHSHDIAVGTAVGIFVGCAIYQASGWKSRLLRACATPDTPSAPRSATYREGTRCGTRCLGASWTVMSLLLALGFMQVAGMAVLAAALLVERRIPRRTVSVLLGGCALIYGVAIAVHPSLAPGLAVPTTTGMQMMN